MRLLARWLLLWLGFALLAETVYADHRRNKNWKNNNNNNNNKKQISTVQKRPTAVATTKESAPVTIIYVITSVPPDPPGGLPTGPPSQNGATKIGSPKTPAMTPLMAKSRAQDAEPTRSPFPIGAQAPPPAQPSTAIPEIINNQKVAAMPDMVSKGTATSSDSPKVGSAVVVFLVVAGAGLLVAAMGIYTFRKVGLAQSQGFKDRLKRRVTYGGQGVRSHHPNGTVMRMYNEYDDGTMIRGMQEHGTIRTQGTMRSMGTMHSHGTLPSHSYPPNVEYMGQPSDLDYAQPPHAYRYDQHVLAPPHLQHTSPEMPPKYRYEGL
ncbi:uncharacterized protein SPPG_00995 [Spizellomyces punctatus DAOM BR117]|uniref:Mid2 domain-containing protein n=1 Tax=Spizellomyces punctatus (strain DAOM BR117) TaxID=645134 RepID=A0A0L0HRL3_SPIPD|nr:uncharacterized protein SPPG_00995 [Spizellomyces punctatus DAOM BR117]KND03514.1 hypothetical protein SPPG_00995 [Spizellomyces punctatus DAOM BR117]|eukprot:XP_016611553.1 hypothetical protein SPPG_00995 [Spizellomyces punctatus DAOM BR117]